MSTKNRYFSAYPTLNPGYLSGGTTRTDNGSYTFQDVVVPNTQGSSSNIVIQPNIDSLVFTDKRGNGAAITTDNFNIIKVSCDTDLRPIDSDGLPKRINDDNLTMFMDILQGHSEDNLAVSYTTPINTQEVFYRNYPVNNNFFNVRFRNEQSSNIHISYEVSLSKFTQFTPPSQLGDKVAFAEMTNLNRNANTFYDDVSRGKFGNAEIINSFGYCEKNISNTQILSPVYIQENTANTFTQVTGVSDSVADGFEIQVSGQTNFLNLGRISNGIEINGTSPGTISLNPFRYIDTVDFPDGVTNTGNISIYRNGTTDLVAYIPQGFRNVSSPMYYINRFEEGVLKEVKLTGTTVMQEGQIEVRLARGSDIETIWTSGILDGKTDTSWTPDYFIPADSTVYAIARNINTTAFATGAERIDLSLKIVKYNTKPVNSIIGT
jgi:hypothetical protein